MCRFWQLDITAIICLSEQELVSLYLFYYLVQADFTKKIQARGGQCGGKDKRDKRNGEKTKGEKIKE